MNTPNTFARFGYLLTFTTAVIVGSLGWSFLIPDVGFPYIGSALASVTVFAFAVSRGNRFGQKYACGDNGWDWLRAYLLTLPFIPVLLICFAFALMATKGDIGFSGYFFILVPVATIVGIGFTAVTVLLPVLIGAALSRHSTRVADAPQSNLDPR